MREFRVKVRVSNNLLAQRREECGFATQAAFARAVGISMGAYNGLEALRKSPLDGKTGEWIPIALKVAEFHGLSPDELWPEAVLAVRTPVVVRQLAAHEAARLLEGSPAQDRLLEAGELASRVGAALGHLSTQEQEVLRDRFYEGETRSEEAARLGRSVARVAQVEAKALRKLRHPAVARTLAPFHPDAEALLAEQERAIREEAERLAEEARVAREKIAADIALMQEQTKKIRALREARLAQGLPEREDPEPPPPPPPPPPPLGPRDVPAEHDWCLCRQMPLCPDEEALDFTSTAGLHEFHSRHACRRERKPT